MIAIRELTTIEEMELVQQLEWKVWGISPIPTHQTFTVVKNGGIIVGAFDADKLIGFSYAFAGWKNEKSYLCSHMLGIDNAYRSQQIGEQLKLAQRNIAIQKGYELMTWTYDPLETRNGFLNLTKLNGICDTYIENCYGEMQDGFNKGLPSDRFEVHWHLTSDYVVHKHQPLAPAPIPLGEIVIDEQGLPTLGARHTHNLHTIYDAQSYSLPVPQDFQALKRQSQEHALHWRLATRKIFQELFAAGYAAVRIEKQSQWNQYIFVKKSALTLEEI
ncbi:GNAT family N-acetyltransferase [Metasolibacillus sp.]|uniref:GNAT family N-acetyltransferase n=1 Tax=Metasolibacillus sp. TaxID=2703680 RepID=UPI0025D2F7C7|nr:GNAT family N-acetyltransferase [Metasolibacillus sp.]MCT6925584.1 GNAT family N-acetyltransferase [Metasolibacillus sp.]MCT6941836.1 GNAT family N-acetyltransferase [Metasolibacillus sp.]